MPGYAGFTAEQVANAQAIIRTGQQVGASNRDILIALGVAITESGLHNDPYGNRDSLGLFQQRSAWGSAQRRMDPSEAAAMFFLGGQGGQRGLLAFSNRNAMSLGAAAQAVQVSAFPDRYQTNMTAAETLLGVHGLKATPTGTLGEIPSPYAAAQSQQFLQAQANPQTAQSSGLTAQDPFASQSEKYAQAAMDDKSPLSFQGFNSISGQQQNHMDQFTMPTSEQLGLDSHMITTPDGVNVKGWRAAVVKFATQMLGTPYVWGGTTMSGVDCSGLVQLALQHAGFQNVPRLSWQQADMGKLTHDFKQLQPGDLVGAHTDSQNPDPMAATHIGIYVGNGMVIQAPRPGGAVELTPLANGFSGGWGVMMP